MNKYLRDLLSDIGYKDAVVFDHPDFDNAIIGVTDDNRVVYDYDKMVSSLMEADGIEAEEAIDFIDYNTIRTIPYINGNVPIVMYPLEVEVESSTEMKEEKEIKESEEYFQHPSECGYSAKAYGIYICCKECKPCWRVDKCPLEKADKE